MLINGKDVSVDELLSQNLNEPACKLRGNGIYLSDEDVSVLNRYDIDYKKYNSLESLVFDIEQVLNESQDLADLEEVEKKLSELNYYNYTNK